MNDVMQQDRVRLPSGKGDADASFNIRADGQWFHDGEPIRRDALVRLFSTILRREEDGYWLVTPAERCRILVEDAPFILVGWSHEGQGSAMSITVETNVGDRVPLQSLRIVYDLNAVPRPYVEIRNGLEARVPRSMFYQWIDMASVVQRDGVDSFVLWSDGKAHSLGEVVADD